MKRTMMEIPNWMRNTALGTMGIFGAAAIASHEMNKPEPEKTVERAPDPPLAPTERARKTLEAAARLPRPDSSERMDVRINEMEDAINLAYHTNPSKEMIRHVDRYLSVLQFEPLTEADEKYASMKFPQVVEELRPIITSKQATAEARKEARRILRGRLHQELLILTRSMSSEDVLRHRVFLGLDIHAPKRATGADMDAIWDYKMKTPKISSEKVRVYGAPTREELKNQTEGLSMPEWIEKQQAATDWVVRHAEEFGFDKDVVKYLTPETMLAIVHAEHFSVLDAKTFVSLSPVLFKTFNIAYMPSLHDKHYSGGLTQSTDETMSWIVDTYGDELERIQQKDRSLSVIVPQKNFDGTYDTGDFSRAMVTDIDSQLVYNTLILAENMKRTTRLIKMGEPLHDAWEQADDQSRARFIATLAPMATNHPGHAKRMTLQYARPGVSLDVVSKGLSVLGETDGADLPDRGANRGYKTIDFLFTYKK